MNWLDEIKWSKDGLVPAIAQDTETNKIMMFAWMNRESLQQTVQTRKVTYYSRSRQQLWYKGESSGHTQLLKEIRIDCDNDVILLMIKQVGDIACHTGHTSCFFKRYTDGKWLTVENVLKSPDDIYNK